LIELDCGSNQLTSLDVSKNTKLRELKCGYNKLTSLDVSKNTHLIELQFDNNRLNCITVDPKKPSRILYDLKAFGIPICD